MGSSIEAPLYANLGGRFRVRLNTGRDFPLPFAMEESKVPTTNDKGACLTTPTTCPRCSAALAPGAQFCGSCGLNLAQGASGAPQSAPSPPPTPPPIPQMPQLPRSFAAAGGPTQQATFSGEPQDAFAQALRAIAATGGETTWQQPPLSAKFVIGKKDFMNTGGFTIKYDGDLQVQKTGPGQTTARFTLKINWGSYVPLGATTVIVLLILSLSNYYFAAMGLLFMVAILVYSAWAVSSQLPEKILKEIIHNLQGGGLGPAAQAQASAHTPPARPTPAHPIVAPPTPSTPTPSPPASLTPAAPTTAAPTTAAPTTAAPAASTTPAAPDTATIVEQIKQLAGLRDGGVITVEEFEAKKAELLKRI
jgi:hypothetical protein